MKVKYVISETLSHNNLLVLIDYRPTLKVQQ